MRSRVAPFTMTYWGQSTTGPVLLDSLAEERLFPQFDRVRWHRWLPDGSVVLLNGEGLYRVRESGEARFLAAVGRPHLDPRLSPDGRWVAVASGRAIAFIPTDGGAVKRLPQPGWVHSIGWHPDSTRLALSAGNRIRVATLDGDVKTLRTERLSRPAVWGHGRRVLWDVPQVEWSADGEYLAYRLVLKGRTEEDYETRLRLLCGGRMREIAGEGAGTKDGCFAWALSGHALSYTGSFADVDTYCVLWTPHDAGQIWCLGSSCSFYHTAWQPHGSLLAVESSYADDGTARTAGRFIVPWQLSFITMEPLGGGGARDDNWPEFEWAPSGRAFCAREDYPYVEKRLAGDIADPSVRVSDALVVGDVRAGQLAQTATARTAVGEVQWRTGERDVTFVRTAGHHSWLCSARVERGKGGAERARRWLAKGKRALRRDAIEEAAVCFRNAARCAGMWAEPRVRLARCYFELSKRERNPACMAWLLWGAEWEMQQAARWQRLSDESRRFWREVSARRERIYSALGIGLPQPGANLSIRKPDQPVRGSGEARRAQHARCLAIGRERVGMDPDPYDSRSRP